MNIEGHMYVYTETNDLVKKSDFKTTMEDEFTREELNRQDFVDNEIYALVNNLIPDGFRPHGEAPFHKGGDATIDWDMEWIGELRDQVFEIIQYHLILNDDCEPVQRYGSATKASEALEMAFYPYRIIEE